MWNRIAVLITAVMCSVAWGQGPSTASSGPQQQPMPDRDISDMPMKDVPVKDMPMGNPNDKDAENEAGTHVMNSMEGHMDMGPHMKMTALRSPKPGDTDRAQQVAQEARRVSEKYTDYHTALAGGYKIFHPEVPQKMYHFTNYGYAMEAAFRFNPEHPTSLLYEKNGLGYKLIGVMYTAPKRFTEDQLNQRIPLSVAQWHEHVNFCAPPPDRRKDMVAPHPLFGLRGSITTREACDAAGGTFHPVIFNWMVHLYPFEKDQAKVWSIARQH